LDGYWGQESHFTIPVRSTYVNRLFVRLPGEGRMILKVLMTNRLNKYI
jgi:hypothetical protein